MMTRGQPQRTVAWQVYDFTAKLYYAGDYTPGHPHWSPYKTCAYHCRSAQEAERLKERVPVGHERRVLEVRARAY